MTEDEYDKLNQYGIHNIKVALHIKIDKYMFRKLYNKKKVFKLDQSAYNFIQRLYDKYTKKIVVIDKYSKIRSKDYSFKEIEKLVIVRLDSYCYDDKFNTKDFIDMFYKKNYDEFVKRYSAFNYNLIIKNNIHNKDK